MSRGGSATAFFAPYTLASLGEEGCVEAGGVIGCEIRSDEEVGGDVRQGVGFCGFRRLLDKRVVFDVLGDGIGHTFL